MDQNVVRITKFHYKNTLLRRAFRKKNANEFLNGVTLKDATSTLMFASDELSSDMIKQCWIPISGDCVIAKDSDEDEKNMSFKKKKYTTF